MLSDSALHRHHWVKLPDLAGSQWQVPFTAFLSFISSPAFMKVANFQATNSHNTSWCFWASHVTNPKNTPQPQAIMQSSRYWKLSLFNDKKNKVQCSLVIFHIKHRFAKISDHKKKRLYFRGPSKYTASSHMEDPWKETSVLFFKNRCFVNNMTLKHHFYSENKQIFLKKCFYIVTYFRG